MGYLSHESSQIEILKEAILSKILNKTVHFTMAIGFKKHEEAKIDAYIKMQCDGCLVGFLGL